MTFDCHLFHEPRVIGDGDGHHIEPVSWLPAGVRPGPTIRVPAGCHRNIHECIDYLVAHAGESRGGPKGRAMTIALEGYRIALAKGHTPRRTL
jgi:hypothetical protein